MCSYQTAYFGFFAVVFVLNMSLDSVHDKWFTVFVLFSLFSLLQATQILLESCDTDNFDPAHIPSWVRRLFVIHILIKSNCIYIHILSVCESFCVSHEFEICVIIRFNPSATDPQLAKANSLLDM